MPILEHNEKAAALWSSSAAEYDAISRSVEEGIHHAVSRLKARAGERVLDIGTGTGWAARQLAKDGVKVVGVDIAAAAIERARELAASESLDIDFRVGDAEALPFDDASFDHVISTYGIMFCAKPRQAVAEVARIVRPGGRLSIAAWTPESNVIPLRKLLGTFMPALPPAPTPPPSPFDWGRVDTLTRILAPEFTLLGSELGVLHSRFRDDDEAWERYVKGFGPLTFMYGTLGEGDRLKLQETARTFFAGFHTELGVTIPFEYRVACAVRD